MVSLTRVHLTSAAIALVALQLSLATGSPLHEDPITICDSYDLGNKNFPGRGSEIEEDSNCVVIKQGKLAKATSRKLETALDGDIKKLEDSFGTKMETTLKNLPTSATYTPSPWNSLLWFTVNDSINYQWDRGQPSATEKYATAFGFDVKTLMDSVSASSGVDSMNYSIACTSDSECDTPWEYCGIRAEASSGYCIPAWLALAHAWAPASILEKEPKCPVTFNGVTFKPLDIKALLMGIYDTANISTVFTGVRYNGGNFTIDKYGRNEDPAYRDLNPGFFHIAAANMLGKHKSTFIIDRYASYEVWTQPVDGFKVHDQKVMTPEEAAQTFYGLKAYPWNEAAKSIVHVKSRLSWSNATFAGREEEVDEQTGTGKDYEYLLEMDGIDQIIGGEWLNKSNDDHPDFLWFPEGKPAADTVTDTGLSYANVTMLLEKSVACDQ
ncbi:Inorganic phosphate transporter family [Phytophthora nicotianae]|uniref:Inorganic phosphate transporter family n=1 Tax=Phytophthora nicotianae TaxID=4792 RepID=A0A0W8DKG4_PHYNI|nr:Inorganic phosphate transporter family [Phytophthora nicotianae]